MLLQNGVLLLDSSAKKAWKLFGSISLVKSLQFQSFQQAQGMLVRHEAYMQGISLWSSPVKGLQWFKNESDTS